MRWLTLPLHREADVVPASGRLRAWVEALGLEAVSSARVVTVGSQLVRAACASGAGEIAFGWGAESDRPFCAVEGPRAIEEAGARASEAAFGEVAIAVGRANERISFRIEVACEVDRDALQRAVAREPEATAIDILREQNLEMARMLATLRDREAELTAALDEARIAANQAISRAIALEEAAKKKDELLAVAAHDIRSPVATAKGALDLLEPTLASVTDDQRHLLGAARRGCDAVVHLVGNLLNSALASFDDDETHAEATVDVAQTTREVVELMNVQARHKGVALTLNAIDQAPIRGDATWLRQVAVNLVNNGVKYTPTGGRVEVRVAMERDEIVLSVDDTGVGVPADKVGRVFDRLVKIRPRGTAGERGTGIGLFVSKRLTERMGGAIAARGRDEGGMHFEVRYPAATKAARVESASSRPLTEGA